MRNSERHRGLPVGNPLANAIVVVVGALAFGIAVVVGFFAFVALAAIVAVLAGFIGIRIWWLNRKLMRSAADRGPRPARRQSTGVIEGEYRVIDRDREEP